MYICTSTIITTPIPLSHSAIPKSDPQSPITHRSIATMWHLVLRVWVLITGLAGLGAAIGAYTKPLSPHQTLYRNTPHTAHPCFARMYATWLLTSTTIRIAFFFTPIVSTTNTIFWLTLGTYLIALWHFVLEIFIYKTAPLKPGGVAPLIVAGASIITFVLLAVPSK